MSVELLLRDLTLEEKGALARRVEIEFVRYLAASEVSIAAAEEGVEMWRTPLEWAFCNGAYLARNPADPSDGAALIDRVMDFFARNHCPSYMIWLDESVDRLAWDPLLLARGLRYDPGSPCLALDTRDLPPVQTLPQGLRIERVGDFVGMDYFARAGAAGFSQSEENANAFAELWCGFDIDGPLECYMAYVGDEIVATAAGHYVEGVVGVEFVSTLPDHRRKGYGRAITEHVAFQARARGYRWATLTASEMGKPVYESIGFVQHGFADNYYLPLE